MASGISTWARKVHAAAVGSSRCFSAAEAAVEFGVPPGSGSAETQLETAVARGWFRREIRTVEIGGCRRKVAYYGAIDRFAERGRKDSGSYFTGIKRCRSIFDLGKVL